MGAGNTRVGLGWHPCQTGYYPLILLPHLESNQWQYRKTHRHWIYFINELMVPRGGIELLIHVIEFTR
jgi:hypothetical protein